jgi:hypothetical protein
MAEAMRAIERAKVAIVVRIFFISSTPLFVR